MFAQIGLGGDPTGGIIVLLLGGALGGVGLILCVIGGIGFFRAGGARLKPALLFFTGLLMASPALWFGWEVFGPDLPRDMAWDFSSSRSVAQLRESREVRSHYFQGNIRSSIKLDGGRQWSGRAYLVEIRSKAGVVTDIHWQSYAGDPAAIYAQTRPILRGLALPDQALDAWHEKVSRGEQASFAAAKRSDTDASIEVQVRGSVKEPAGWATHVNVWWKDRDGI